MQAGTYDAPLKFLRVLMNYALSTIRVDGAPVGAVVVEGRYWLLPVHAPDLLDPSDPRGLMALFDDWASAEVELAKRIPLWVKQGGSLPGPALDDVLAPLLYPGKVCCTGANYRKHLSEVGLSEAFDKSKVRPSFFHKPPRTAVVGSGRSVRYPVQSSQFDWEIELAVVIGKTARHVSVADALDHVAAYTVGLDLSARDYLLHPGNMAGFDSFGGKGFDDSCPLGPALVPARFVSDPQQLSLRLAVNGQVKQEGNTSEMVWSIAEQIAEMSAILTLEPGDVLLTGTPHGSGLSRGEFLKPGDVVVAEIGEVGRLELEIVASPYTDSSISCRLQAA
jgi:2-keto-4-pentenoate hydratase/2-oxohepta-3-ene-1,7-dioic acid hydratase in catechol pathway